MTYDTIFRPLALLIFVSGVGIGFYFRYKAQRAGERISNLEEGVWTMILLRTAGFSVWLGILAYLINPRWMAWAAFDVPLWLRWFGVGMGIITVPLFYWLFSSIGKNITTTVAIRAEHQLVTHGPYRWVRHPLYTVGTAAFLAQGLMAANAFILVMNVLAFIMLMIRLPLEEARLIEAFGDAYRHYQQRTGALLPRWTR